MSGSGYWSHDDPLLMSNFKRGSDLERIAHAVLALTGFSARMEERATDNCGRSLRNYKALRAKSMADWEKRGMFWDIFSKIKAILVEYEAVLDDGKKNKTKQKSKAQKQAKKKVGDKRQAVWNECRVLKPLVRFDKPVTICMLRCEYKNRYYTALGAARCCPTDEWNADVGASLAKKRAKRNLISTILGDRATA